MKTKRTLGYVAASLTVLAAVLVPFVLIKAFANGFGHLGLHIDYVYSGGPKARTVAMNGYTIDIHQTVKPHMLQRAQPFVQLVWTPVAALPAHVDDSVDIDNDGKPDVRVMFDAAKNAKTPLRVNVEALNKSYANVNNVGKKSFSELIVRVDESIIVRVPETKAK